MNSLSLSLRVWAGAPRSATSRFITPIRSLAVSFRATCKARHSRLYSSMRQRMRSLPRCRSDRPRSPTPDVVEPLRSRGDRARGTAPSSGPSLPTFHPQPAVSPDALHELAPHLPALRTHQARELALAQPRVFKREGLHVPVQPQEPVRRRFSLVATAGAMQSQVPASPPLRAQPGPHHALNGSGHDLFEFPVFSF